MEVTKNEYIERLQEGLPIIRKVAGWSAEELGNLIGVTKQTISNIENKKTPMTLTQYIAIRAIIDYEIQNNPNSKDLQTTVSLLVDNENDDLSDEQAKVRKESIQLLSKAAAGGLCGSALASSLVSLLSAGTGVTSAALIAGGAAVGSVAGPIGAAVGATIGAVWLTQVVNDISKKNKSKKDKKNKK